MWVDGSNLDRSIIVTRSTEFQDRSLLLIIDHFIYFTTITQNGQDRV